MDNPIRIASVPGAEERNPYLRLFYKGLEPSGFQWVGRGELDARWLDMHRGMFEILHLHWPEPVWRDNRPRLLGRLMEHNVKGSWRLYYASASWREKWGLRRVRNALEQARHGNVKVVWTLHNLEHHEGVSARDVQGYQMIADSADLIIGHSHYSLEQFEQHYGNRAARVLMYHGNYDGVYPAPAPRERVLKGLGLEPDAVTLACIGAIRPYKGAELALEAMQHLDHNTQLIIAGPLHPKMAWLLRRISEEPRFKVVARALTEQEFSDVIGASDLVLLPYRKITGSGALLAALTFGRGVVASSLPYFEEILAMEQNAGILADANDPVAWAQAIKRYLDVPAELREAAAFKLSKRFQWSTVLKPVAQAMRQLAMS